MRFWKMSQQPISNSMDNLSSSKISLTDFKEIGDDMAPYSDKYQTAQQATRDEYITFLLEKYKDAYAQKNRMKQFSQKCIWGLCASFIMGSTISLCFLTYRIAFFPQEFSDLSSVISFITAFVSFSSLIFGLMTIITKYAFPEDDEKYITEIVKAIQENDLKNKSANMGVPETESKSK